MLKLKINKRTKINPLGRKRFYSGQKDTAVLLFHGFSGVPAEMAFLGKKINEVTDFNVYIPRLPGHGTDAEDFRQTKARDWLRKAYDSFLELNYSYEQIYIGGLSMGGLLALLTAGNFKTKKLFTISAALYTKNPLTPLTPVLKYFLKTIPQNKELEYENLEEKKYMEEYHQYHYLAQIAELYKLMKYTRKNLKKVESKTLIIASKNDELVPMKAAYQIKKKIKAPSKKVKVFSDSPHVINDGPEKEKCANMINRFLIS
ncbi:MAG: alpha/beta hydrolase [Halanaerobiales bacterium]